MKGWQQALPCCSFLLLEPLKWVGVAMALPMLILSVYLTWLGRNHRSDLYHNIAVTLWICANSVWMFGEFFFEDTTRAIALPFFLGGILSVGWFHQTESLKKKTDAVKFLAPGLHAGYGEVLRGNSCYIRMPERLSLNRRKRC